VAGFSIGADELTRFIQQSSRSSVLNRVVGQDPSLMLGRLQSNGRVFLINPNGIAFGAGSRVDVGGLVASTLDIGNDDFLADRLHFRRGTGAAALTQLGSIRTAPAGRWCWSHRGSRTAASSPRRAARSSSPRADGAARRHREPRPARHRRRTPGQVVNVGELLAQGGRVGIHAGLIRHDGTISADHAERGAGGEVVLKAGAIQIGGGSVTTASGAQRAGSPSTRVAAASRLRSPAGDGERRHRRLGPRSRQARRAAGGAGRRVRRQRRRRDPRRRRRARRHGRHRKRRDQLGRCRDHPARRRDRHRLGRQGHRLVRRRDRLRRQRRRARRCEWRRRRTGRGLRQADARFPRHGRHNRGPGPHRHAPPRSHRHHDLDRAGHDDRGPDLHRHGGHLEPQRDDAADGAGHNNVVVDTTSAFAGAGNISVNNAVTWASANSLELRAHNNISVGATINATGTGALRLVADQDNAGGGNVAVNAALTARSGGIAISGVNVTGASTLTSTGLANQDGGALAITASGAVSLTGALTASGGTASAANPGRHAGAVTLTGASIATAPSRPTAAPATAATSPAATAAASP
jgi:filamentous hemagglutinin family protein